MKKSCYLFGVLFSSVLFSSCTNDDDLGSSQTNSEDDGRKGKLPFR